MPKRKMSEKRAEVLRYNFGRLLAEKGMSQSDYARLAGTKRQYVTYLLNGTRNIGPLTYKRIADALGVDHSEMLRPIPEGELTDRDREVEELKSEIMRLKKQVGMLEKINALLEDKVESLENLEEDDEEGLGGRGLNAV